jgi:hypothetical protein
VSVEDEAHKVETGLRISESGGTVPQRAKWIGVDRQRCGEGILEQYSIEVQKLGEDFLLVEGSAKN